MNKALLIGGALGAWWLLSKAHTGQNLQFVPLGASWDGGALRVDIGVQNPTNDSLTISSIAATVSSNGTPIGNISDFTSRYIAANTQTPVQLAYTPNLLGVLSAIANQIKDGGGIAITIKGAANVNGIGLPINLSFQAISE